MLSNEPILLETQNNDESMKDLHELLFTNSKLDNNQEISYLYSPGDDQTYCPYFFYAFFRSEDSNYRKTSFMCRIYSACLPYIHGTGRSSEKHGSKCLCNMRADF